MLLPFCLGLLLAVAPVSPRAEELQPGVRVTIPFGGIPGPAADPRLSLRVDYRADESHGTAAHAPAVMAWTFAPRSHELAVAGVTLAAADYRRHTGESQGRTAPAAITAGAVATVVGAGTLVYYFMRSLGIAFVEATEEMYTGGGTQENDPCAGVAVGEECVGGS